jgi:hypothetical protein
MGTILQPFAIKIEKLKQVFNSNDEKLYNEILEDDYFKYLNEEKEWLTKVDITVQESLKRIIFGGKQNGRGFTYGYALRCITDKVGESLAYEGDVFYRGQILKEANELLSIHNISINLNDMLEDIYTFDIPKIEDFPRIGGLSRKKIAYLKDTLSKIEISNEEIDDSNDEYDEVKEMIFIFRRCVNYCFNNDLDWITFAY